MKTAKTAQVNISVRPPIIVIVGHIDHGKSTLLDYIRKSNIVAGEAGGITQHISAYEVNHKTETGELKKITFLDTPGHEAFSKMRVRGANLSDIAILIVSAEEGVKPQTLEAIKAVEEANIPYVVAINKIDRPNANPEKVKQELGEAGVYVESYGGKIPSVNISAKTGEGVSDLLDLLLLVAELENLSTDSSLTATGFVLESHLDNKVGATVTLIIKDGSINVGDFVAIEDKTAKIKKIENFLGDSVKSAVASSPIKVFGFNQPVDSGKIFTTLRTKKDSDDYLKNFQQIQTNLDATDLVTTDTEIKDVPLVVKSDSHGTLEAVINEINKIAVDRVRFKIIDTGIGTISDADLKMLIGSTNEGIIAGFNVKIDRSVADLAERHKIDIQTFDIIYKLTEWLEEKLTFFKPEITEEVVIGQAKILKIFSQNKTKQVLGGNVETGLLRKGATVKIFRREAFLGQGKVLELQAQKLAVGEVAEGNQFGAIIDSKVTLSPSDTIQVTELKKS